MFDRIITKIERVNFFLRHSVSVSLHSHLTVNELALFRAANSLLLKTTLGMLRNGGLSWLKQHDLVIFRYIFTKPSSKVYILSFNSCVKFHAKICTHC